MDATGKDRTMTDMDWNNRTALMTGAQFVSAPRDGDWQPMSSAPRDGTWVELKCTYGVAPWYCLARWTDEDQYMNGGTFKASRPGWKKQGGGGPSDEGSLQWRPYRGDLAQYTDPTGGLQHSMAYWRGAVAAKHGLPLNYFEKQEASTPQKPIAPTLPRESVPARSPNHEGATVAVVALALALVIFSIAAFVH